MYSNTITNGAEVRAKRRLSALDTRRRADRTRRQNPMQGTFTRTEVATSMSLGNPCVPDVL